MQGQSEECGRRRRDRRPAAGPRPRGRSTASLVVVTEVPDIVVTLAMSFVWAGCALLVLDSPGGGAAVWLKALVNGSAGSEWVPRALLFLVVAVGARLDPAAAVDDSASRCTPSAAIDWPPSAAASRSAGPRSLAYALTGLFCGARRAGPDRERPASARRCRGTTRCRGRGHRARWREPRRRAGRGGRADHRGRDPVPDPDGPHVPQRQPEPGDRHPGPRS